MGWEEGGVAMQKLTLGVTCVYEGSQWEFTGAGIWKGQAPALSGRLGLPGAPCPCPFSSLSPSETGTMLSTVTLVRTGLGAGEPETDGAPAADGPFSSCSASKDVSLHAVAPALFKAPGPGLGAVLTRRGPCPPCPRVFSLHRFPSFGPRGPGDGQSLITAWLTCF